MIAGDLQSVQVWIAATPIDMRKSFDGLVEVVRSFQGHDPLSGNLFVFRNRGGHRIKILWWDRNGLAIYYKRLERGEFQFPRNASERALKRVAIGRKNWLFAGNDAAAENHARLWSLIASAERHDVDPQRYLTSVLAKIGTTPTDELEQFLPDVWRRDDVDATSATQLITPR